MTQPITTPDAVPPQAPTSPHPAYPQRVCRYCELPALGAVLLHGSSWWLCRIHLPLGVAHPATVREYPAVMHPDGYCYASGQCRTERATWQLGDGPRMRGGFVLPEAEG